MKRRGELSVTYELIANLLGLDERHQVICAISEPKDMIEGNVRFIIDGATCPEIPEGGVIPSVVLDHRGGVE